MVPGSETAPALAGLEEVLAPVVVEVRADPLVTADLGDALFAYEALVRCLLNRASNRTLVTSQILTDGLLTTAVSRVKLITAWNPEYTSHF